MWENPEGGELDLAEGVRRLQEEFFRLSCIGKRTRECCDRGSEVGTANSGRDGEGPVPPRKPKESGRRGSCEKYFVSKKSGGCAKSSNAWGQRVGNMGKGSVAPVLASEYASSLPRSSA